MLRIQTKHCREILGALQDGPLTLRELQRQLGPRSRGACSVHVLDYFTTLGGMSSELREAIAGLLWRGAVEVVPVRGAVKVRLAS